MAELVFHKIQLGAEGTEGTAIPATVVFPTDPGAVSDLDRAPLDPVEDYGTISEQRPGRGAYGVRLSRITAPVYVRFEDIMRLFEMSLAGGVTPTGTAPTYTWTYTGDETSDTLKSYTIEEGTSDGQAWQLNGCLVDQLVLEFGPITVPGDFPWKATATIMGRDRKKVTFTGALSAPSNMESVQGHLTTLLEGDTSTAYASLAELAASLLQYRLTLNNQLKFRAYGSSASDTATAHGRSHRQLKVEAMVKIAANPTTDIYDVFNAAGSVATERRWRVKAYGSGTKVFQIDHRIRFNAVALGDRDAEQVYQITGTGVYDTALGSGSIVTATVLNGMATLT